jgi:hypothetical protein
MSDNAKPRTPFGMPANLGWVDDDKMTEILRFHDNRLASPCVLLGIFILP